MMVVITCSTYFFKFVNDYGAILDGVSINHSAVWMVFLNCYIKFKPYYIERTVIDWKYLKQIPELNGKFNLILRMKLRGQHYYTVYNEAILSSTKETSMVVGSKCQG